MTEIPKSFSKSFLLKEQSKKEAQERKRSILYLMLNYLVENNLNKTADLLKNEAHINDDYQLCDNIDLEIILQEYQSYYSIKFQRQPKILRKNKDITNPIIPQLRKEKKTQQTNTKYTCNSPEPQQINDFQINIISLSENEPINIKNEPIELKIDFKNDEYNELAQQITNDLIQKNTGIKFEDCIGLEQTIELLKEAIIYPTIYPELFINLITWHGILLYGPPGTGKTLLAKALANESTGNLINVTSSTFISKWRGESEKMLKVLFEIVKKNRPLIIFIDEIDALASTTKDTNHEASKRFKSELLTHIDGITTTTTNDLFILATTNCPWNIDTALLRRFEKRILVPLPNKEIRKQILQYYFLKNSHKFTNSDLEKIAKLTENYSGSDLKIICKELNMILIREIINNKTKQKRNATIDDLIRIIEKIKPCFDNYDKYYEWAKKFGSI